MYKYLVNNFEKVFIHYEPNIKTLDIKHHIFQQLQNYTKWNKINGIEQ